jgi:hypothetical protein
MLSAMARVLAMAPVMTLGLRVGVGDRARAHALADVDA